MRLDPILLQLDGIKERLDERAGGETLRFLDQMEAWLDEHPHPGPVVGSVEGLRTRVRQREADEPPPSAGEPYKVHDPISAEIHRIREQLERERAAGPSDLALRDEPPRGDPPF